MNLSTLAKISLAICLLGSQFIDAQTITPCATDDVRKKQIQANPEILEREAAFNKFADDFANHNGANQRSAPYIIPVVFHIIHDYGAENISDEQIYNAIDNMNKDYSKSNTDFWMTVPEFAGIAADCEIEFRLAQRTLSGACTDGIERIPSLRTYEGSDAAKLDGWQSAFYLNIWVVKDLQNGAAAYAYYPTSIDGFLIPADGVICRYDYVGSIGAAGSYSAHTLSHEVGHYLNLSHCWGNTNSPGVDCGDDQVMDTPVTEGWTSCNLAGASCGNDIDNVQNFMEYSYCSTMFTEGQKARMQAALNSDDAYRNNLWTPENLEITGTSDGYIAGLCQPVADFYSDSRFICAGDNAYFHDVSWGGEADSRSWEFEGGTPSTSTDINPTVTFSESGWHKVTLTVNNASGSSTSDIEQYIYISSGTANYNETYFGNFNDEAVAKSDWVFYNKYPDAYEWNWLGTNGYWAGGCAWLNSRFSPNGETDVMISPAIDLSSGVANNLFFKYSTTTYAYDEDQFDMSLKVYYSTNCGRTWIMITQITGDDWDFSYGGGSDFFPTEPEQWSAAILNLPTGAKQSNVRFKFEFVSNGYANNIFIDDVNFTTFALNTDEIANSREMNIWPNPASVNDEINLSYVANVAGDFSISLTDLSGKTVFSVPSEFIQPGTHEFHFNPSEYGIAPGCYFIITKSADGETGKKLIVF